MIAEVCRRDESVVTDIAIGVQRPWSRVVLSRASSEPSSSYATRLGAADTHADSVARSNWINVRRASGGGCFNRVEIESLAATRIDLGVSLLVLRGPGLISPLIPVPRYPRLDAIRAAESRRESGANFLQRG